MTERDDGLTSLQRLERTALCGDRMAIVLVVSGLRAYRSAMAELRDSRGPNCTERSVVDEALRQAEEAEQLGAEDGES